MKYHVIPLSAGARALELHRQHQDAAIEEFVTTRGSGELFDPTALAQTVEALWQTAKRYKTPDGHLAPRDRRGGEFEAKACEIVHRTLKAPRYALSDPEFWLWVTLASCESAVAALVDWRFGPSSDPKNYGVTTPGSFREGLLARLWWRGDIGHKPEDTDPYAMARTGDQDIWRSHVFRTRYGRNREFAREFVAMIYNGERRTHPLSVERAMAKLTRARHASTAIEVLDSRTKRSILSELVGEAAVAAQKNDA